MKKIMQFFLIATVVIMMLVSCDGCDPVDAVWEIRLVPISTTDLAKAVSDENGQLWLPASEVPAVMAKTASVDIDFGDVKATKTLQYVLMNVGNRDVYDITFAAEDITIYPTSIGLIPTPGEGGEIIAMPIVSFIKEHVIPIDGVGSLSDMEVGEFTDAISLSYNYTLEDTTGIDSFDVTDTYTVAGTKRGAIIEVFVSGQNIVDALKQPLSEYALAGFMDPFLSLFLLSDDMDTMIVENNGNALLRMRIINQSDYLYYSGNAVLDTIIQAGESINVSGLVRGDQYFEGEQDSLRGNIVFFGADRDQPYIFEILGLLCIDGLEGLLFSEIANPY